MKKSGLRNRFNEKVKNAWLYWFSCMVCKENGCEVLHHIISPSSSLYIDGAHNNSIYNSCPVHNQRCHVGNEAHLYDPENIKLYLLRTRVTVNQFLEYEDDDNDREFKRVYAHLYPIDVDAIMTW